jgi:hypothetical protein
MRTLVVTMLSIWTSGVVAQVVAAPESFLIEAAKQVPALLVLAWIVYSNNKERRESETARAQIERDRDVNLAKLGDACHVFQDRLATRVEVAMNKMADAMEKSVNALGQATLAQQSANVALERLDTALERLDNFLEKKGGRS